MKTYGSCHCTCKLCFIEQENEIEMMEDEKETEESERLPPKCARVESEEGE